MQKAYYNIIINSLLWTWFFPFRVKSRWFRIQFEELSPKLKGSERCQKEVALKTAMKTASKSISVVTSHIHKCIVGICDEDNDFQQMESFIEEACSTPSLSEIDHRAQRQFAVMLFCCKKVHQDSCLTIDNIWTLPTLKTNGSYTNCKTLSWKPLYWIAMSIVTDIHILLLYGLNACFRNYSAALNFWICMRWL